MAPQYNLTNSQLSEQLDNMAVDFGWDPSEAWIQGLKRLIGDGKEYSSAFWTRAYAFCQYFDPEHYVRRIGSDVIITARYRIDYEPDPLEIAARVTYHDARLPQTNASLTGIIVEHYRVTFQWASDPPWLFECAGWAGKFRAEATQYLLKATVGIELPFGDTKICMLGHKGIKLIKTDGKWVQELI